MSVRGNVPGSGDATLEIVEGTSDAEGEFALSTFRLPTSLEVEARHAKLEKGESIELSGGSETVEVRLKGPLYR